MSSLNVQLPVLGFPIYEGLKYCKFRNFRVNFIFANRVKRHICHFKNLRLGTIHLHHLMIQICCIGYSSSWVTENSACWVILHAFLSSADFVQLIFPRNFFRNTNRVPNSLDPDQAHKMSGLIWVQNVFKGYQQTTRRQKINPKITINFLKALLV